MKSSHFDEAAVIPWLMPRPPRTPAERSKNSRMEYDQRYMAMEFASRSFDLAYRKGEAARVRGLPFEACPISLEMDGSESALQMAWEIGWENAELEAAGL